MMPDLRPRPQFRTLVLALGRRVLVGAIAGSLCIGPTGAANEDEEKTRPPNHPYLAPAPSLEEMARGDPVERAMERSARVLFPELAQGTLPATDFGALSLPSPSVVLFRQTGDGTLVEMREQTHGVYLRDLTHDETPPIATRSRPLHPEIATASVSAIRRALTNARHNRPMIDGDVEWVVVDGVSYYFFSGDVGSAHSPGTDTEAGQLVQLFFALREFVNDQVEEPELSATGGTLSQPASPAATSPGRTLSMVLPAGSLASPRIAVVPDDGSESVEVRLTVLPPPGEPPYEQMQGFELVDEHGRPRQSLLWGRVETL